MPLFEMECPMCHKEWEVLCKHSELTLAEYCMCHACFGMAKPKLSKTAPPQFNGDGFYATDYKVNKN